MAELGNAFKLGQWLVEPALNRLTGPDGATSLEPRTMAVLAYLAQRPGEVISADELIAQVWHGRPMGDNPVYKCVAKLRHVMQDDAQQPRYIETVSKKGYRLVAAVVPADAAAVSDTSSQSMVLPTATPSAPQGGLHEHSRIRLALGIGAGIALALLVAAGLARRTPPEDSHQSLVSSFPGSHTAASLSPDGKSLAFVSDHGGVPHVWVSALSGDAPRQLTFGATADDRPRWMANGRHVLFQRGNSIWLVPSAGGAPKLLLPNAYNPHVSRDGRRIVFERAQQLWIVDVDGGRQQRVAGIPEVDLLLANRAPALSPDGRRIVFFQSGRSPMGDLWLVDAAGGNARQLTRASAFGGSPTWTPDGLSVIYSSQRGGSRTLWKVSVDDGGAVALLNSTGDESEPDVSGDGKNIVYTSSRDRWVLTVSGPGPGQRRDLMESRQEIVAPAFSPDGRRVAYFGATADGAVALFTVPSAGGMPDAVTRQPGAINVMPQWSRDGRRLYFYQSVPEKSFRSVPVAGGASTRVVPAWEWNAENGASVSPDGTIVVYTRLDRGRAMATMQRDLVRGQESAFSQVLDRPRWSHDGRQIAGTRGASKSWAPGEVVVCAVAGGECRVMAQAARLPQWSHDDARLYYVRPTKTGMTLFSTSVVDGGEHRLFDLDPLHPNGGFYDIDAEERVVWIRYERSRRELWSMELRSQ